MFDYIMLRVYFKSSLHSLLWTPLLLLTPALCLATVSDLFIAMESDGRSHTVQHTIGSNGTPITLALPGSVIPQEVRFIGPDQEAQTQLHKKDPSRIQLSKGSAFARYHHQYGQAVEQTAEGEYVLTIASRPDNVVVEGGQLEESSITWVFPSDFEVTSYTVTDSTTGKWVAENNMLTFHQLADQPVTLGIRYKHKRSARLANSIDVCTDASAGIEACAPDNDADGIPDYRDICLKSETGAVSDFGCEKGKTLVLKDVKFTSCNSYLDVSARKLLDRVASAIQRLPDAFFEVGSHTDNQGAANFNKQLSRKRAEAVRHYLMLKGVNPNSVRATGYGEAYPVEDNASADGRRANRRIELSQIR